jgi:hypothetical protein
MNYEKFDPNFKATKGDLIGVRNWACQDWTTVEYYYRSTCGRYCDNTGKLWNEATPLTLP